MDINDDYDRSNFPLIPENRWPDLKQRYHLTKRELETVKLICDGHTKSETLAEMMGIKLGGVKSNLSNIFNKVGKRNKTALVIEFYKTAQAINSSG